MLADFESGPTEPHWGDRWGDPETCEAYLEVRHRYLQPYLQPEQVIVEIGSGGGRWTQYLLPFATRLKVVELNPESFDHLRRRFSDQIEKLEFVVTTGSEMGGVPTGSIDLVFTFDVFVHLEPEVIGGYLTEIAGAPGGRDRNRPLQRQTQANCCREPRIVGDGSGAN
jgi:SAM-dependent methyltransferase